MPSTKDTGIPAAYVRGGQPPTPVESFRLFVNDELRKIELAFKKAQLRNYMVIENRTDDPNDPEVGRIWLRTDL
jgi:hypothetical protein